MVTPCACIYATIFFAWFEHQYILNKYADNLIMYKCQIDDMFGIWIDIPKHPNNCNKFQNDLNSYCKLEWNTEELSKTVNFLDLTLYIEKHGKLNYKAFQKPMNLFLYIPTHSAHPLGVTKSLINGLITTYHRQNSNPDNFKENVSKLFGLLLARGYNCDDITPILKEVAHNIDKKASKVHSGIHLHTTQPNKQKKNATLFNNDAYFHLLYHPNDISRSTIQSIYNETCNNDDALGENFKNIKNGLSGTMRIKNSW
jgi:hypothetical protein